MLSTNEPFQQEVIHENEQIYQRILDELKNARSQILVATAWFTDPDLFQTLLDLADQGISVKVIIADNDDNKKLDFEKLRRKGAAVYKLKKTGYGGMQKKFCIVDQRIAIHGSYNWTINARINNQASVIVTNHAETVQSLIEQFDKMEMEINNPHDDDKEWNLKSLFHSKLNDMSVSDHQANSDPSPKPVHSEGEGALPLPGKINFQSEYANVLDGMIAAEVCNFDRTLLRSQGYERAKANNGDAQILNSAMDTVYSVFINDINVVEDKKKRLAGKINEQKIIHSGILENNYQTLLHTIEAQTESTRQETTIQVSNLKAKADVHEMDVAAIKNQKLIAAEKTGKEIEDRIKEIEQDSIIPQFKWYEFIPVSFLSVGLFCYLVLFYSSAVYILLFSERDAKRAQLSGAIYDSPQVFEPHAFSNILKEGGYAISFVCLFVFIPLAISVIGKLAKESPISKGWVMVTLILLLDIGIAYKVAASIHEAGYLVGNVAGQWHFTMVFFEPNFYLVFLLGSFGLLIFNVLFNKLITLFEERNPDVRALQLKLKKEQEKEDLDKNRSYVATLNEHVETFNKELVKVKNDIHLMELDLAGLPHKKALLLEKSALDFENNKKTLNNITVVYISHIENDILPISLDSMKDRINVFLEGWTSFLNDEYAVVKAVEKSKQAVEVATIWQKEKLASNHIDNRIKALQ